MNVHTIQQAIILVRYDTETGEQVARYSGFITGDHHAMYAEEYGRLCFATVVPTHATGEYLAIRYFTLGKLDESHDLETTVQTLANKLNHMSAFDFMTEIMVNVSAEIEFDDLLV